MRSTMTDRGNLARRRHGGALTAHMAVALTPMLLSLLLAMAPSSGPAAAGGLVAASPHPVPEPQNLGGFFVPEGFPASGDMWAAPPPQARAMEQQAAPPAGAPPAGSPQSPQAPPPAAGKPADSPGKPADPKPADNPAKPEPKADKSPAGPPPDPCQWGVCQPPGKAKECIMLEKKWSFRDIMKGKKIYLPLDWRPYFEAVYPSIWPKYKNKFPAKITNITQIDLVFSSEDWGIMKDLDDVSHIQSGCKLPTQRWYQAWFWTDIYQFFQQKGDDCAQGGRFDICALTLDQRADRVIEDWDGQDKICGDVPEYRNKGMQYVEMLRHHPFRSDDLTTCMPGEQIEEYNTRCGFASEVGGCLFRDQCPLDKELASRCDQVLSNRQQYLPSDVTSGNPNARKKGPNVTLIVLGSAAGIVVLFGLFALGRVRRKSSAVFKTIGRTLGRARGTLGRSKSVSGPPPPPPIVFAPQSEAPVAPYAQQQPYAAPLAHPAPVAAPHGHVVQYVDEMGQLQTATAVPGAAPPGAPVSAQGYYSQAAAMPAHAPQPGYYAPASAPASQNLHHGHGGQY